MYKGISDSELIYLVRNHNYMARDYLLERYRKRIYGMIDKFKNKVGVNTLDYEDYYHESLVVFLRCIDLFQDEYNFFYYVSDAIMNHLFRVYNKDKRKDYISIESEVNDNNYYVADLVMESNEIYEQNELTTFINSRFDELEKKVIYYKLQGYKGVEIASLLNITLKSYYKKIEKIKGILKEKL